MTLEELIALDHEALKQVARDHNISVSGNHQQLAQRVHIAMAVEQAHHPERAEQDEDAGKPAAPAAAPAPAAAKRQFKVTPKNGSPVVILDYGVPAEGTIVEEGHPLLRFSGYFNVEPFAAGPAASEE